MYEKFLVWKMIHKFCFYAHNYFFARFGNFLGKAMVQAPVNECAMRELVTEVSPSPYLHWGSIPYKKTKEILSISLPLAISTE